MNDERSKSNMMFRNLNILFGCSDEFIVIEYLRQFFQSNFDNVCKEIVLEDYYIEIEEHVPYIDVNNENNKEKLFNRFKEFLNTANIEEYLRINNDYIKCQEMKLRELLKQLLFTDVANKPIIIKVIFRIIDEVLLHMEVPKYIIKHLFKFLVQYDIYKFIELI